MERIAATFSRALNDFLDPNTAIAFLVFDPAFHNEESGWIDDPSSFYDWFLELEETWSLDETTLAPFHPQWTYHHHEDDRDDKTAALDLEKQSPYPTVSIVSTAVIDKAGEAATAKIAAQNEAILCSKSVAEWNALYNAIVRQTPSS